MKLAEALNLKRNAILNLDSCICLSNCRSEDVSKLKEDLSKENNILVNVIDVEDWFSQLRSDSSSETNLVELILKMQRTRDIMVKNPFILHLINNYEKFYQNDITEMVKKLNPSFLCWFVSFIPTFYPLMVISTKENELNRGIINITANEGNLKEAVEKGLEALDQIISEESVNSSE